MKNYANTAIVYDFCLDWQMGYIPKSSLIKRFKEYGWSFNDFKSRAEAERWFVPSMNILNDYVLMREV